MNYAQVLARLAGRVSRKVGQHTYLHLATSGLVFLRFHDSHIITWMTDGRIVLDSHGNRSATTRRRFNQWLPADFTIGRDSRGWFIESLYKAERFTDGMTIYVNKLTTND